MVKFENSLVIRYYSARLIYLDPRQNLIMVIIEHYPLKLDPLRLSNDDESYPDEGLSLEEAKPKLKKPSLYKVVMLNDDYTPMEFVVQVLEKFFGMNREKATRIMLEIHTSGKAVCGIYTQDVAETKADQVNQYAQENEHPLLCEIESIEGDGE